MLTALYIQADSPLHRARPALKLLALFAFCTGLMLSSQFAVLAIGLSGVVLLYRLAKVPFDNLYRGISPVLPFLAVIFIAQWILSDWALAIFVCVRFLAMILAANLVTLTTRSSDLIAGIEGALNRLPERFPSKQVALAMSLCLRFIPTIMDRAREIHEAQAARGLDRSFRALAVPLVLRTLKSADEITDALHARSFDLNGGHSQPSGSIDD